MKILFPSPLVHKLIAVSAVLLATALAGGCATPTTSQGMTPTAIQTAARHDKTVSLKVSGGQETEAIGKSQISNAAYAQALTDAINNSKIFSSVPDAMWTSRIARRQLTIVNLGWAGTRWW